MNLKNWKSYLAVIGILIFIYILAKINLAAVFENIKKADLFFLALSILLVLLYFVVQTAKWFFIAVVQKIKVPFKDAFIINLISNFYGFITPSKLGVVIRAEYLKKYTSVGKGLSNFVLDKILDTFSVFFLAVLFSFTFKEFSFLPRTYFMVIFVVLIMLTFIFLHKERSKFLLRGFYRKLVPERMKEHAKITFDSFYEAIPKKRYFLLFFLLNIIAWIDLYIATFLMGMAVGIQLPFVYYLAILPIGTLVSLIPITINGLGTREASMIVLFGLFGVAADKVFSMSILSLVVSGVIPAIIGSFLSLKNKY